VPSAEAASTTSTSSIAPSASSSSSAVTIASIVEAHSRAVRQTLMLLARSAAIRSGGYSE